MSNKIAVIGVPSSAGARQAGQELAPSVFRDLGLIERFRSSGAEVLDFGDLSTASFNPDLQNPKCQNLADVTTLAKHVAEIVDRAVGDGAIPVVLGGDCTVTVGVLAGLLGNEREIGLVYFDGDTDLNTPETTLSGILDGMVMAHILGMASDDLARIGPRFPLMSQKDIVFFGYNQDAGWIDPFELDILSQTMASRYPSRAIRGNAPEAARNALEAFGPSIKKILVHFDVDVIDSVDFPAADVPHKHGLSFSEAMEGLSVFVSSPLFGGLVITEFNVRHDEDGEQARRLVDSVGDIFKIAHDEWQSAD